MSDNTKHNPNNKFEMLETIINSSEAGVYVSDYQTGEILFANQKTAEFIGGNQTAEELIGKTCWKALNKDTNERCEFCAYKKLIGENGELLSSYSWERYFEEYGAWAKITNQAIRWSDGRLAQITTFHDITEMKSMQELLAKHIRDEEQYRMQQNMQILLDRFPVAVGITDIETTAFVYANRVFLEMFGFNKAEELLGRSVLTILPQTNDDGISIQQRLAEIYDTKGINAFELEFITASGTHLEVRLTTCVLDYNNRKSSVGIVTDIAAEKEQKRLLMQAAERERESNLLKSKFLSNMSHEIRTPLNAIMGMSEIIGRSVEDKEKTISSVHKLKSSSQHLLSIVNDILDMAKIESGKFELVHESFSLKSSFGDVMSIIVQRCNEKNIQFTSNVDKLQDFTLIGDKTRINQVLINLLGNAVKFTDDYGEIQFLVDIMEETEKVLSLKYFVSDNGIGIEPDNLSRIFQPYEQAGSTTAIQYGGTGLGLAISHNFVSMMGGTLCVESEPGKGSDFSFELCLEKGNYITSKNNDSQEKIEFHRKRILLVEDIEINREIVCELLSDTDIMIEQAENGQSAVDMFMQSSIGYYDLIFMDIQMPIMNGYEATQRIRALERQDAKGIPIVAMTANAYKEDVECSLSVGMNAHISKPIEGGIVLKVLQECFGLGD